MKINIISKNIAYKSYLYFLSTSSLRIQKFRMSTENQQNDFVKK